MAPYTFQPVYPVDEALQLARDIKADPSRVLAHSKQVCGILGCVFEKHDDEPEAFAASAAFADLDSKYLSGDLTGLADELETSLSVVADGNDAPDLDPAAVYTLRLIGAVLLNRLIGAV